MTNTIKFVNIIPAQNLKEFILRELMKELRTLAGEGAVYKLTEASVFNKRVKARNFRTPLILNDKNDLKELLTVIVAEITKKEHGFQYAEYLNTGAVKAFLSSNQEMKKLLSFISGISNFTNRHVTFYKSRKTKSMLFPVVPTESGAISAWDAMSLIPASGYSTGGAPILRYRFFFIVNMVYQGKPTCIHDMMRERHPDIREVMLEMGMPEEHYDILVKAIDANYFEDIETVASPQQVLLPSDDGYVAISPLKSLHLTCAIDVMSVAYNRSELEGENSESRHEIHTRRLPMGGNQAKNISSYHSDSPGVCVLTGGIPRPPTPKGRFKVGDEIFLLKYPDVTAQHRIELSRRVHHYAALLADKLEAFHHAWQIDPDDFHMASELKRFFKRDPDDTAVIDDTASYLFNITTKAAEHRDRQVNLDSEVIIKTLHSAIKSQLETTWGRAA